MSPRSCAIVYDNVNQIQIPSPWLFKTDPHAWRLSICYVNKEQIIVNLRQTSPLDTLFSMKGHIAISNSSFQEFREKTVWNPIYTWL